MTKYNKENILVGAATIFLGTDTAAVPTYATAKTVSAVANAFYPEPSGPAVAGWTPAGLTTGGVEVTYTPDFGEVEVDQWLDAAVMFKQRMSVTVGTTLSEATLDNLLFAWGQADGLDGTDGTAPGRTLTILSGELGERPAERQLVFIGRAPGGSDARVYHLKRCLNVEASAHSLSRADATTIPVSLRCLPDNDGEYGTITDHVGTVV